MRKILPTLLLVTGLLAQTPQPSPKGINWYSLEKEAALGKTMRDDLLSRATVADEPDCKTMSNASAKPWPPESKTRHARISSRSTASAHPPAT
jgi:hypothetical protein